VRAASPRCVRARACVRSDACDKGSRDNPLTLGNNKRGASNATVCVTKLILYRLILQRCQVHIDEESSCWVFLARGLVRSWPLTSRVWRLIDHAWAKNDQTFSWECHRLPQVAGALCVTMRLPPRARAPRAYRSGADSGNFNFVLSHNLRQTWF
jgi:hypothetical protein